MPNDELNMSEVLNSPERSARFFVWLGYPTASVVDYLAERLDVDGDEAVLLVRAAEREKKEQDERTRTDLDRQAVEAEHDVSINPNGEVFPDGP